MTQNFSDSSKQSMLYSFAEWAGKYLKTAKGFTHGTWYGSLQKTIELSEEELAQFIKVWTGEHYEAYTECLDAGLLAASQSPRGLLLFLDTGLEDSHLRTAQIQLVFPRDVPIFFGSEHNHYRYLDLYKKFPALREALPESVVEAIDDVLNMQTHALELKGKISTYTRARQLLDQLPTFLRFMPASIRNEMKVTNIRRAMRADTKRINEETILFFAIMNLLQPMDE